MHGNTNQLIHLMARYSECHEPAFLVEIQSHKLIGIDRAIFTPDSHFQCITASGSGEEWLKAYNQVSMMMFSYSRGIPLMDGNGVNFSVPLQIFDKEPGPFHGEIISQSEFETYLEMLDIDGFRIYH